MSTATTVSPATFPRHSSTPRLRGNQCRCPTCGALFSSTAAFDQHRRGTFAPFDRRCRNVAQMLAYGLHQNVRGFWCTRQSARRGCLPSRTSDDLPRVGVLGLPALRPSRARIATPNPIEARP